MTWVRATSVASCCTSSAGDCLGLYIVGVATIKAVEFEVTLVHGGLSLARASTLMSTCPNAVNCVIFQEAFSRPWTVVIAQM